MWRLASRAPSGLRFNTWSTLSHIHSHNLMTSCFQACKYSLVQHLEHFIYVLSGSNDVLLPGFRGSRSAPGTLYPLLLSGILAASLASRLCVRSRSSTWALYPIFTLKNLMTSLADFKWSRFNWNASYHYSHNLMTSCFQACKTVSFSTWALVHIHPQDLMTSCFQAYRTVSFNTGHFLPYSSHNLMTSWALNTVSFNTWSTLSSSSKSNDVLLPGF
ncbi:hypothetical protein AVEN_8198-1 [Araneus ventricosus]|uniref:Uncharacterized protein n=1 Tax=Araneus ventricosus TaxID=182803 RepID=A0A4Y2N563_ARAVE|nr:hypothetical protein AVEN_8198-1 [Araneus ventricosus]